MKEETIKQFAERWGIPDKDMGDFIDEFNYKIEKAKEEGIKQGIKMEKERIFNLNNYKKVR